MLVSQENFNCLLSIKTWEIGKANLRETEREASFLKKL